MSERNGELLSAIKKATADVYGPSLARAPRSFRAEFGDDDTLLATVDKLLGQLCAT